MATASPSWRLSNVFRFCSINGAVIQAGSHPPHPHLTPHTQTQRTKTLDMDMKASFENNYNKKKTPRYLFTIYPSWSPCSFYPLRSLPHPLVHIHWREYDPPCRHVFDRDTRKRRNHHADKQDDAK